MSEVYLTKIERKTIFTKSLIFVLIMFILSDLTVTGPFWFNFVPWMFILGTVGSLKKIDSTLMCIIGTFTVFISSVITQGGIDLTSILSTVITIVTLVLGIVTGRMCYEFVLEHRLVKYIKRSKKIMYIVTMTVMLLASFVIVGLNSGNIVTYLKARTNLKQYIVNTYDIKDFNVINAKYVKTVPGKYTFKVKIDGQEVVFTPVSLNIFKDANKDTRFLLHLRDLENETAEKKLQILEKYPLIQDANVKFELEYSKMEITPDIVTMSFKYVSEKNIEQVDKLYEQIANCVKELQTVKEADKITITVNKNVLQLSKDNVELLTKDYIKDGFKIEEISD